MSKFKFSLVIIRKHEAQRSEIKSPSALRLFFKILQVLLILCLGNLSFPRFLSRVYYVY
jgi:hypothetical protein